MPGRKFDAGSGYRYGFNGKEKDKDITNEGYDFGDRILDSRIGRWYATDPFELKYPSFSPYNYSANNPIYNKDVAGKFVIPYAKDTREYKAAILFINYIRTEVNSWSATDPKWQAFQALTGTTSKKEVLRILENGKGPDFAWGSGSVTQPDGSFLMRGNGKGFVPKSSYALTTGVQKITFDQGIMEITLQVNDLKNALAEGLQSKTFSNPLGGVHVKGVDKIRKQIAKAEEFLTATGTHELAHEEYNRNGTNATLNPANSDQVIIPMTPINVNLFGASYFNTVDPITNTIQVERGDTMEQAMLGKNVQYANCGLIPLLQYTLQSTWCQLQPPPTLPGQPTQPAPACFPTESDRAQSLDDTKNQQQQAIINEVNQP